jgi:hypothetical protein
MFITILTRYTENTSDISTTSTLASLSVVLQVLWGDTLPIVEIIPHHLKEYLHRYCHHFVLDFEFDLCLVEIVEVVEIFFV